MENTNTDTYVPSDSGCIQTLGDGRMIEVDEASGRVVMEFTGKPEFCHTNGTIMQGGFVTGMIDAAMAHAVMMKTEGTLSPATLEIKVSFFRPASPGVLRAVGWIERMGRSTAFLEGELYNAEGALLAKSSSTAQLIPMKGK